MKERLDNIKERYDILCQELLKPEIYEDYKKMQVVQSKELHRYNPLPQPSRQKCSLPELQEYC